MFFSDQNSSGITLGEASISASSFLLSEKSVSAASHAPSASNGNHQTSSPHPPTSSSKMKKATIVAIVVPIVIIAVGLVIGLGLYFGLKASAEASGGVFGNGEFGPGGPGTDGDGGGENGLCTENQFSCNGRDECIPKDQRCDGIIQCKNGDKDEKDCLSKEKFTMEGGAKGIVLYDGRQICSSKVWNKEIAKVFCKQIHPNSPLLAAEPQIGLLGIDNPKFDSNNFINLDLTCKGKENSLNECDHKISSQTCGEDSLVKVTCFSQLLELRNSSSKNVERRPSWGALFIDNVPVCSSSYEWTEEISNAVCEQIDGPGSAAFTTEWIDLAAAKMADISCNDDKTEYQDCSVQAKDECLFGKQPVIACFPCNNSAILDRVRIISEAQKSLNNSIDDMMTAVKESREWLKSECQIECGTSQNLSESDSSEDDTKLSIKELNSIENYHKLWSDWEQMARCKWYLDKYYNDSDSLMARSHCTPHWFERTKRHYGYIIDESSDWSILKKQKCPVCTFDLALEQILLEFDGMQGKTPNRFQLPELKWSYKEEMNLIRKNQTRELNQIALDDVADNLADFELDLLSFIKFWSWIESEPKFQMLWVERLKKLETQLEDLKTKESKGCSKRIWDKELSDNCSSLVKQSHKKFRLNLDHLKESRELRVRIKEARSLGKSVLSEDEERERVIKEEMDKLRGDLKEKYRSKHETDFLLSSTDAEKKSDLEIKIDRLYENVRKRIGWHEEINRVCHLYEYMNGGEPVKGCVNFNSYQIPSFSPFVDSFDMCDYRQVEKRSVVIPAMRNKTIPGTVDMDDMFRLDGHATFFQIPNEDWLVKHFWITEAERSKGPFFLREFTVFPLPFLDNSATFSVETHTPESPLGEKTYVFSNTRSKYWEDLVGPTAASSSPLVNYYKLSVFNTSKDKFRPNPYNVPGCTKLNETKGVEASRIRLEDGIISPSIFSPWLIKYNKTQATKIYPTGIFYLKAQIQICFGSVGALQPKSKEDGKWPPSAYPSINVWADVSDPRCDGARNPIAKNYQELYHECPANSKSQLHGHFCEVCPAGMDTPNHAVLECRYCPPRYYKPKAGKEDCKHCNVHRYYNDQEVGRTSCQRRG